MSQTKAQLLDGSVVSVAFSAGSAATPSLYFAGDLNTGIYSPGADQVAVATNGTRQLDVNSSGQFRIGNGGTVGIFSAQAVANGNLHIRDIASVIGSGTGVALDVLNDAGSAVQDLAIRGTNTIFRNSAGETLRITSAGLVGIGTSAPAFALDISASTDCVVRARVNSSTSAGFIGSTNNGANNWFFGSRKDSIGGNSGTDRFNLLYDTNAFLTVTAAGNVGIGTTSPGQSLSIVSPSTAQAIGIWNRASDNIYSGIYFKTSDGATDQSSILNERAGTNGASLLFYTKADGGSTTERARIDSSGRVGIGTSSPTELLHVNGNIEIDTAALNAPKYIKFRANSDGTGTPSYGGITWYNFQWDYTKRAEISSGPDGAVAAGYLAFSTGSGGVTERMRVSAAGNVGIGTTSPGAILDVKVASDAKLLVQDGNTTGNVKLNAVNNAVSANVNLEISASNTQFFNGGSERARIDSSGRVGIGTTVANSKLSIGLGSSTNDGLTLTFTGDNSTVARFFADTATGQVSIGGIGASYFPVFYAGAAEKARIDTSGRLLVGTSSARSNFFNTSSIAPSFQVEGTTYGTSSLSLIANGTTASVNPYPLVILARTRGTSVGSTTIVSSGDLLGGVSYQGADGTEFVEAASIIAEVDGTPGANDMPGRLVFSTTADGAATPTERMRINAAGAFKVSTNGAYLSSSDTTNEVVQSNSSALGLSIYTSSASYASTALGLSVNRNTTNNTYYFIEASVYGVAYRFQVADSGNVTNANNSYGGISDRKFKENIVDAASQWNDIKALQVCKYNFKEETGQPTHTQIGLIAQEVELISPGLVNESPDRDEDGNDLGTVTKSVNYSVLYMKAVKALQEAMERIEALEADVAQLKGA